ncbi:MAG: FecR domain-containing protein [Sandaracinaceae bacterium]
MTGRLMAQAALTAVLLMPHGAVAQEMRDYTVREGDSCGAIAQRVYGNSRRYDLIHQHNPELGAMPHRLEAGTQLRLPVVETNNGADATVTSVRRRVGSQPPQASDWGRARVGQELEQGWRVNTEERSHAELTFRESSVAQVREQTLVIIYGQGVRRVRREGARAVLLEGGLLSRIGSLSGGRSLEVETPSSLATLRGGESSIDVEEDGTTRVAVHSGEAASVARANGSAEIRVPVGSGTRVRRGRPPSRPRPLPRAPEWTAAQPDTFLSVGRQGGTIRGAWEPARNAARYRVEVARRRDGRELLVSQEVGAEVRELEFHRLPPGTYFLRVITLDEERFEGRPSQPVELTVHGMDVRTPGAADYAVVPPADPFGLETLDEPLPDEALEQDAPEVHQIPIGSAVRLPSSMRCRLGEGPVSNELTIRELGPAELTCEGQVAAFALERVGVTAEAFGDDGVSPPSIAADGTPSPIRVRLAGLGDVSQLVFSSPGVETDAVETVEDGEARVILRSVATTDAPADITVRSTDGLDLARIAVPRVGAGEQPEPVVAEPEQDPGPHGAQEAFGLPLYASWVGLVDERRRGSGMHAAMSFTSAEEGDADPTVRVTAGLRAAFFDDRLRVDVAVPVDALGGTERTARRGSRDVYAAVSSLLLEETEEDSEDGFGLAAEAGVFLPTGEAQGLDRVRLRVAVDGSLRVLDERLVLRTRQAGLFDLDDVGSRLWASAYGADVWIVGPWSAGAEVALTLGEEDGQGAAAAGVGLATHLDFGAIDVSLGGRVGFGDPNLMGLMTLTLGVRGTMDFGANP